MDLHYYYTVIVDDLNFPSINWEDQGTPITQVVATRDKILKELKTFIYHVVFPIKRNSRGEHPAALKLPLLP